MLFALLLLLCVHTIVFTGDLTSNFPDDKNNTVRTNERNIVWAETPKNMVKDLGTEHPITLPNVSKKNFECLQSLMMEDTNATIDYKNKTISEIKRIFKEAAWQKTYTPQISKPQFLIEANYLDIPKKCMQAFTFFYAREIKDPTITFNNGKIVFDNIPHDPEPYIAGWLSRNTLKSVQPEILKHELGDQYSNILAGPVISGCAADGSFACTWKQIGGNDWAHAPSKAYTKVCIVDQQQQTHSIRDIDVTGDVNDALCSLSSDKNHLLFITRVLPSNNKAIQYYDLQKKGVLKSSDFILTHYIIENALFNHENKKFTIVAADENDSLAFMTIDPTQKNATHIWDTHKRPDLCKKSRLSWNYVHGYLIGINTNRPTQKALIYTGKELIACLSESSDPRTITATVNEKKITIDYDIITDYPGEKDYKKNYLASEISYIPNLTKAMPRFGFLDYKHQSPFDLHNACINIMHDHTTMTINFIPRKLNQILHLCSDKLRKGDTNILPYAYAAHCYYSNKESWQEKCKTFLPHKPEIREIFEEKIVVEDELEPNSCNPS